MFGSKVYIPVLPSWGIPEGVADIEDCVPQTVPLSPLSGHGNRTMPPDRFWLFFFLIFKVNADFIFSLNGLY